MFAFDREANKSLLSIIIVTNRHRLRDANFSHRQIKHTLQGTIEFTSHIDKRWMEFRERTPPGDGRSKNWSASHAAPFKYVSCPLPPPRRKPRSADAFSSGERTTALRCLWMLGAVHPSPHYERLTIRKPPARAWRDNIHTYFERYRTWSFLYEAFRISNCIFISQLW